jgi:hypothetical protein
MFHINVKHGGYWGKEGVIMIKFRKDEQKM